MYKLILILVILFTISCNSSVKLPHGVYINPDGSIFNSAGTDTTKTRNVYGYWKGKYRLIIKYKK